MSRLEEIDVRTLVIWGQHDVLDHRLMGEELVDRVPNAEGHCFEASGHMPNNEKSDRFNDLVTAFLATALPTASP